MVITPEAPPAMPFLTDELSDDDTRLVARQVALMMKDGVVIQASDGQIMWHNAVASRILRMTPDQLMSRSSMDGNWDSIRLDGSQLPGAQHPAMRVVATGLPVEGEVMGVLTGSHDLCWVQVDSFPLDLRSGRVAVSVFTDVTEQIANRRELESTLADLQATLVQTDLPGTEAIQFAGAYRSVGMSQSVGGDFYGAYETTSRRHDFFIGDVCGHEMSATATSVIARNSLRGTGPSQSDPSRALTDLHRVLEKDSPTRFLTALVGYVEHGPSHSRLVASSGGHPLPILVRDGVAQFVGCSGSLVGMLPNAVRPTFDLILRQGDQVICYTNGLTDCSTPRLSDTDLLREVPTGVSLEDCVETLSRLGPTQAASRNDDAAILAFEAF